MIVTRPRRRSVALRNGDPPMPTVVRDLMSSPVVTCEAGTSLAQAASSMRDAAIGSVVVTDRGKVAGILTDRDLLAPRLRPRRRQPRPSRCG